MITFIHYIENMPIEDLSRISKAQQARIINFIGHKYDKNILNTSMNQLKYEYAKVMNKLIFNKWIGYLSPKLVGKKINSPLKIEKEETR